MRKRRSEAILYAFDLLWLNKTDLRSLPLIERKRRLRRLVKGHEGLLYAEQIQDQGMALFEAICAKDLEGMVAKHRLGPYAATPVTWFKVLNPDYSQKRCRQEVFEKFLKWRQPETLQTR